MGCETCKGEAGHADWGASACQVMRKSSVCGAHRLDSVLKAMELPV